MPEKVLKKFNEYILPQWKICFFAAVVAGLFAHLYKITNWLPNWDSLVFRYDSQNMVALGRWFLPVVTSLSSFYDLPFLNGIVTILFHALGAVCICKIMNIQKTIPAFLTGAIVVSFPSVTSLMMYNYVADGYSIAFFMSTLAALFMTSEKPKYIASTILIALSAGIYQAYITVTVMLVLFRLIDEIIFNKVSFLSVVKKCIFMLLSGTLGMVLYYAVLKLLLTVLSVELLDYQGVNSTASLSGINLAASLYVIKETFIKCFFDMSGGLNLYIVLNALAFAFSIIYYVKYMAENKLYKKPVNLLLCMVFAVMLVVGAGILAFINAGVDYHNLMRMGYCVFYLFLPAIYERGTEQNEKITCIKCWIVLVLSGLIITNQVVTANVSYHKAQMAYEKSYGVLIRIADRIEQTEGAEDCDKLLVVGALENSEDYSVNFTPDITGITDGYIIRADDETVGQSVLASALSDYCEKNYLFISGEEKKNLLKREDIKNMEKWPSENCMTVIDNILVVKLGTEGEN